MPMSLSAARARVGTVSKMTKTAPTLIVQRGDNLSSAVSAPHSLSPHNCLRKPLSLSSVVKAGIIEILRLRGCGLRHGFADQSENEFDALGIDLQSSFHRLRFRVDRISIDLAIFDFGVFGDDLIGPFRVGQKIVHGLGIRPHEFRQVRLVCAPPYCAVRSEHRRPRRESSAR